MNEAVDWIEAHGLTGDPFSTKPLKHDEDFDNFFVKTHDIEMYIDPLWKNLTDSESRVVVIGGPRGIGKSTILHYINHSVSHLGQVLTAYIGFDRGKIRNYADIAQGIGSITVRQIIENLLISISTKSFDEFLNRRRSELQPIADAIGFDFDRKAIVIEEDPSWGILRDRLKTLCGILRTEAMSTIIEIDGYDKLDSNEQALSFLMSNYGQEVFELLEDAGAFIILSSGPLWLYKIKTDPDLNYLGKPVGIEPLNIGEFMEILEKRVNRKLKDSENNIRRLFDDEALRLMVIEKKGVIRDVMELAKACLIVSAQRPMSIVTADLVRKQLEEERAGQGSIYELISTDEPAKLGLSRLQELRDETDYSAFRELLESLNQLYTELYEKGEETVEKEPTELSGSQVDTLRQTQLVSLVPSPALSRTELVIEPTVKALLRVLHSNNRECFFVDWMTRTSKDSIVSVPPPKKTVAIQEINDLFTDLLRNIPNPEIKAHLRQASDAYAALRSDLYEGDYDPTQTCERIRTVLRNSVATALSLDAFIQDNMKDIHKIKDAEIEEFLLHEGFEKEYFDYSTIIHGCEAVTKGAPLPDDDVVWNKMILSTERILIELLRFSTKVVASVPEKPDLGLVSTTQLEQISNRIQSTLKNPGQWYFVAYREDTPEAKLVVIGWRTKNKFFANVYGSNRDISIDGLGGYLINSIVAPAFIEEILANIKPHYGYSLHFYNVFEIAKCLSLFANTGLMIIKFFSLNSTTELQLLSEERGYKFKLSYLPAAYRKVLQDHIPMEEQTVEWAPSKKKREGSKFEKKSSLRYNYKTHLVDDRMEKEVAKTIAGFLNADGGILWIGVSDDDEVLGLENDYSSLKKPGSDGFELKLREILQSYLQDPIINECIDVEFQNADQNEICIVRVSKSPKAIFLRDKSGEECYVRVGNSTKPYSYKEFMEYVQRHFKKGS